MFNIKMNDAEMVTTKYKLTNWFWPFLSILKIFLQSLSWTFKSGRSISIFNRWWASQNRTIQDLDPPSQMKPDEPLASKVDPSLAVPTNPNHKIRNRTSDNGQPCRRNRSGSLLTTWTQLLLQSYRDRTALSSQNKLALNADVHPSEGRCQHP